MLQNLAALTSPTRNATITEIGRVRLFWSYESLIAFEAPTANMFNPVMRKLTATTSGHASRMGCAKFPDAATPEAFAAGLRVALCAAF